MYPQIFVFFLLLRPLLLPHVHCCPDHRFLLQDFQPRQPATDQEFHDPRNLTSDQPLQLSETLSSKQLASLSGAVYAPA